MLLISNGKITEEGNVATTGLPTASEARFGATLKPAHDLIAIHKRNPSAGRRVEDLSLNRGAVVFAVAAWQAYVEELTETIVAGSAPPPGDPTTPLYRLLAGRVRDQIKRFNTPNARNTLELLGLAGFDPTPAWSLTFTWEWQYSTRYTTITRTTSLPKVDDVTKELDAWLLVRHRIAHGDEVPRDPERVTGSLKGKPRLQRRNADRCIRFFEALVVATGAEARKAYP